jgi:hypothetical protein
VVQLRVPAGEDDAAQRAGRADRLGEQCGAEASVSRVYSAGAGPTSYGCVDRRGTGCAWRTTCSRTVGSASAAGTAYGTTRRRSSVTVAFSSSTPDWKPVTALGEGEYTPVG